MDEFSQFLSGGAPKAQPTQANPAQSGNVNQFNVGNLRPVGASSGFQQPSSFEEGLKSMDQNLSVYGSKHKINTLRGVISRWAPETDKNDTENYIKYVAEKTGLKPDQQIDLSNPAVRHVISGPMILMEKGNKAIFGVNPQQTQSAQASQSSSDPFSSFLMGGKSEAPAETAKEPKQALKPKLFGQAEGAPSDNQSFMDKFAERSKKMQTNLEPLVGAGEAAISTIYNPAVAVVGAGKGIVQSIPEAIKTGQAPAPIGERIGSEFVNKYTYQPKTETGKNIIEGIAKVPEIVTGSHMGFGPLPETMALTATPIGPASQEIKAGLSKAKGAIPELKAQFETRFPKFEEPTPVAPAGAQPTMAGVGAAKTEINPYAGKITGEETARGQYPTVKLSKVREDAPGVEQSTRADIANEILGNSGQVRSGVLTGNENTLRQEYTEARSANPTPKSELLKRQIAEEQNALSRYAEKRIENSGASNNLPTDYERGQLMNDAIIGDQGFTGYLKTAKDDLYTTARQKVGDNPIQSESVSNLLQNKQFRAGLGLKNNEGVAKSAEQLIELAKTVGFEDRAGNVLPPNSIAAWKAVREALNGEWTKDNASTIGKINRAIDQDIALAGGQDLYKKADNLHKAEKKIFGSKGIKTLFGEVDPNGVQTGTSFEAIPKKLNTMPVDQWKHIYDTFDEISKGRVRGADFDLELTPELIEYANAAKAEMRGALAREIYQAGAGKAGVWNQNSVNNILNARAKKIEYAFTPEEQRAFHTLNYAGHIMPGVHAYEGAALQGQRVNQFAEKLPAAGRIAGAMTRLPFAETAGNYLGEKAAQFTIGKSEKKQASKLQEEMMKNAQKGKTNLKDIGKE